MFSWSSLKLFVLDIFSVFISYDKTTTFLFLLYYLSWTDRPTDRQPHWQTYRLTDQQTDSQRGKKADRQGVVYMLCSLFYVCIFFFVLFCFSQVYWISFLIFYLNKNYLTGILFLSEMKCICTSEDKKRTLGSRLNIDWCLFDLSETRLVPRVICLFFMLREGESKRDKISWGGCS